MQFYFLDTLGAHIVELHTRGTVSELLRTSHLCIQVQQVESGLSSIRIFDRDT